MSILGALFVPPGRTPAERQQRELAAALAGPAAAPAAQHASADGRAALFCAPRPRVEEGPAPRPHVDQATGAVVVFDGVLHNEHELRAELRARGRDVGTGSAPELALQLWLDGGAGGLRRMRGPWALILHDPQRGELVAGRGPFGLRPLYGMIRDGHLLLAGRLRTLAALSDDLRPDPAAEAAFLVWGAVPEPRTPLEGVFALRPGRLRRWQTDLAGREEVVLDVPTLVAEASRVRVDVPVGDARAAVREALHETLRAHVQDIEPAVLVGGGRDAAALLALIAEIGLRPPTAVTVGLRSFAGGPDDPVAFASAAAAAAGARHVVNWCDTDELAAAESAIIAALDQPVAHGLMLGFAARAARDAGMPVIFAAIGGDELFGATAPFEALPRRRRWTRLPSRVPGLPRLWQQVADRLTDARTAALLHYGGSEAALWMLHQALHLPSELPAWMGEEAAMRALLTAHPLDEATGVLAADPQGEWSRIAALELGLGLRLRALRSAADVAAAHGVEVRLPLVDALLWTRVLPIMAAYAPARKRWLLEAPRTPVPPTPAEADPAGTLRRAVIAAWDPGEAPEQQVRVLARRVWRDWWASLAAERKVR